MIALALLAAQPELPHLPIPLDNHGWEEVGSQAATNDANITMRYWLAPDSVRSLADQPELRIAAVTVETILADGTQHQLNTIGHVIDCKARSWQIDWGAFTFDEKAFVSYFARDQRGTPNVPEAGSGMAAVVDRVCAGHNGSTQ